MAGINVFNDEQVVKRAYSWLRESRENDTEWRDESKEDIEFYLGKQWKSEDKEKLESGKRPALTINEIRSLVKLVSGYQRSNRYPIRIYGKEASDDYTAQTLEELILDILSSTLYQYQDAQRYLHAQVCGRGYMFGKMDYSEDWLGEIAMHARLHPRHVFYDRMSRDITLSDAQYIVWVELVRDEMLRQLLQGAQGKDGNDKWGELQDTRWESDFEVDDWPTPVYLPASNKGDRFYQSGSFKSPEFGKFYKVLNVFYRTWEDEYFIADNQSGELKKVADKDEMKMLVAQFPDHLMAVQRQTKKIKSALVCGNVCIDHKESTTSPRIFPIIPTFGGFFLGETFGMIRDLKDVQRFLNKRFSNYSHTLNTLSNSGWVGDQDALDDWTVLENQGGNPGLVIKKKRGADLKKIESSPPPAAEVRALTDGTNLVKVVSGINPDLLGIADKDTSGRAILLRQNQGYQVIAENIDNHRLSTVLTAQWIVDAIQRNYTYEKTFRILMPNNQVKYLTVNKRMEDYITGVERILNDVTVGRYDVVVSDQAVSPAMRYLYFQELIEMIRETGAGVPLPVLVKASNLPQDMKHEVMEALAQPIPPEGPMTGQKLPTNDRGAADQVGLMNPMK